MKYYIKTYGCQMNVNDSEVISGLLEEAGYAPAETPEDAGVILINTCCVRQSAEDRAMGYALSLISLKMRAPGKIFGICGCIAEKDKEKLIKKLPFFDLVVGPGQEGRIVQLIEGIRSNKEKVISTGDFCGGNPFRSARRKISPQAYVTIMTGCDNFCSYCVVPYVRGREISRPAEDIINEIKELDKSIYKEVVLLGQNVNSYKIEELEEREELDEREVKRDGFVKLLEKVDGIEGLERFRFFTSHPRDMSDLIINAVNDLPKACEFFHIPLQSGDDDILNAMNRGYTADHFRSLVGRIRDKIPEATITSDVITGFPGESERQFENTLELIRELELDLINTFSYSIRPGTKAAQLPEQLLDNIKSERLQRLMTTVENAALKRNQKLVGSTQEVLIDSKFGGRTRGNKQIKVAGEHRVGDILYVRVNKASSWGLEGVMVS